VPGELVRAHLLGALAARFDAPVTVVVAGAGFGKTTMLAQAIRANEAAPRGIDAWVACEPGDEDAGRLAMAIVSALGATVQGVDNVERVLGALSATAPVDVCVFFDDLHELPRGSAGEQLVQELATRLPSHAHLVLASRDPLSIRLARRRAAGQVVDVGGDALAFTDAEVAALADRLGHDRTTCDGLAGWPSLVRLVLSAPVGATRQFLWEEIVAGLSPTEQSGLLALSVLGSGSVSEVVAVAGVDVDVGRLVRSVPLLYQDAEGRLGAHQLWEEALARLFPPAQVVEARRRALEVFVARGETLRVGSGAVQWDDPNMFRLAIIALVRENLGALPADTAARWFEHCPPRARETREHRLLHLAVRQAEHPNLSALDDELDSLEADFADAGDRDGRTVALALGAHMAHTRGDVRRLVAITHRIKALPDATQDPLLHFFVDTYDAALAALSGELERSLDIIDGMSFDRVPAVVRELVRRLHVVMLVLAGRADEAVPIGRSLLESSNPFVRSIPSLLRWSAGDPSEYLAVRRDGGPLPTVDRAYRFWRAAHGATVAASLGDRPAADAFRREIEQTMDTRDPRSALSASALACCKVLDHDDEGAASVIAQHLARHPLADRHGEVHLRHNFAVAYIASPLVRERWDAAPLGPMHVRAREVAHLFLAARDGRLSRRAELGSPASIVTSLPLPWSVELAVRADGAGCPDGSVVLETLSAWLPGSTHRELDWLAAHGDATCRRGAAEALVDLPLPGQATLSIDVLGPLRLRAGTTDITGPELRRSRVRTLLALLVLRGAISRERAGDLVWPKLDPDAAAQNLRVTLSHLRRLLDRPAGRPSGRIRGHRDSIELAEPPLVDADLRRFRRHLADADQAQKTGDTAAVITSLTRATEMWRGDPLSDLATLDELTGEVEHVRQSLVDADLRLGELLLVAGRFDDALHCADRCRAASPYSERAHRLTIACQLQRHDRSGLESAVRSARGVLDDLGVEPEDATRMLLNRAAGRLGTLLGG
jgi:DNA-binding SARP family transcriptional activator